MSDDDRRAMKLGYRVAQMVRDVGNHRGSDDISGRLPMTYGAGNGVPAGACELIVCTRPVADNFEEVTRGRYQVLNIAEVVPEVPKC